MKKAKNPIPSVKFSRRTAVPVLVLVGLFAFSSVFVPFVQADRYQEQINQLNADSNKKKEDKGILGVEAKNLGEAIASLQSQINATQESINRNEARIADLQNQIKAAEAELERQRDLLGQTIRAMYVEGDISTVEMLATSKDLSDFFDKQQYRESVNSKIKSTLEKINQLKQELNSQKDEVTKLNEDQKRAKADLANQRAEKDRVLALNQQEQSGLEAKIKENNAQISKLKEQQIEENRRIRGSRVAINGVPGGGGYPWGDARCLTYVYGGGKCYDFEWGYNSGWMNFENAGKGYGYRNCTDWVAWRGNFPGGLGNAANWPDNAAKRGLNSNTGSPVKGAAAINDRAACSGGTCYGHVMYVEDVRGDGSIIVSDYNGDGRGQYDSYEISASNARNLKYVYR